MPSLCGCCRYFFNRDSESICGDCLKISLAVEGPYGIVIVPMRITSGKSGCPDFKQSKQSVPAPEELPHIRAVPAALQPGEGMQRILLDPSVVDKLNWLCGQLEQTDVSNVVAELIEFYDGHDPRASQHINGDACR